MSKICRTRIVESSDEFLFMAPEELKRLVFTQALINRVFSTEKEEILKYLVSIGLIKNSFNCPCLNDPMNLIRFLKTDDGYIWRCSHCKGEKSVRAESFFEGFKKDFKTIFMFIYYWSKDFKQCDIAHELSLSKKTVVDWCYVLREACQLIMMSGHQQLGGLNPDGSPKIVEIDESLFFKRKYNRGRLTNAQWVFGMIERGSRRCVLIPVEDRSQRTLRPLINAHVLPGSIIMSDQWLAYNFLDSDPNYTRFSVNHSLNFVNPDNAECHTQNIENCWLHAKRKLKMGFGTQTYLLDGYLFEFMFKYSIPKDQIIGSLLIKLSEL